MIHPHHCVSVGGSMRRGVIQSGSINPQTWHILRRFSEQYYEQVAFFGLLRHSLYPN